MSTHEYTSTFYLNRHSRENAQSQWVRHLQSNAYIRTLGDVVERNRVGLERTINAASAQQEKGDGPPIFSRSRVASTSAKNQVPAKERGRKGAASGLHTGGGARRAS